MKILKYLFGTSFLFGILTSISYHNGMAYDGEIYIGFPLPFYNEGVGHSLQTGQMRQYTTHSVVALLTDLTCSLLLYIFFSFLYTSLKRRIAKSKN